MEHHDDCIFCQIATGAAPCFKICEDDRALTFLDLFPVAEGHALVVPKAHATDIFEMDREGITAVSEMSLRVAGAIRRELAPDGLGVFQLNGAAAGQTVFHYHMHLLPRTAGVPFELHSRVRGEDAALARTAERLAAALD
jgi:histidine triad (HIT) family protein